MKQYSLFIVSIGSLLLFTSCGKHETAGGTVGAATGAVMGSAVAGKKSKGTGALLGALIGNYIGREAGRSEDEKEQRKEQTEKLDKLRADNKALQQQLIKWCPHCNQRVKITSAQTCPDCGDHLIHEKYCHRCKTVFTPETTYRYCPYCSVKVALDSR